MLTKTVPERKSLSLPTSPITSKPLRELAILNVAKGFTTPVKSALRSAESLSSLRCAWRRRCSGRDDKGGTKNLFYHNHTGHSLKEINEINIKNHKSENWSYENIDKIKKIKKQIASTQCKNRIIWVIVVRSKLKNITKSVILD